MVRTRVQQRRQNGDALLYRNTAQTFRTIVAREGARGLYKGMGPHLLRVMPQSAITFLVYERTLQLLQAYVLTRGQVA